MNMDMQNYNHMSETMSETLQNWISNADAENEQDISQRYCLRKAIEDKIRYNHTMAAYCRNENEQLLQKLKSPSFIQNHIQNESEHERVNLNMESQSLDYQNFCIDSDGAQIFDDAINYNSVQNVFTVHISDVVSYLRPNSMHPASEMIRRNLLKSCTSYGVEGRQDLFPSSLATSFLSLLSKNNNRKVISVSFRIENNQGRSGVVLPLSVRLSTIRKPLRYTFRLCEELLFSKSYAPCITRCGSIGCRACTCEHFQQMHIELMRFRRMRFPSHEDFYRNDLYDKHKVTVSLSKYAGVGSIPNEERVVIAYSKKHYTGNSNRLVEEAMVASSHALSKLSLQREYGLIQKGDRPTDNQSEVYNGGRYNYSPHQLMSRTHRLEGFVPWTNPIRNAIDYVNHSLLHLHLTCGDTQADLTNQLESLCQYLAVPSIVEYCSMLGYRSEVLRDLNRSIEQTCIYQYLANIVRNEEHFAKSRRRQFVITIRDLNRGRLLDAGNGTLAPEWTGTVHMNKFGCEIRSFALTNYQDIMNYSSINVGLQAEIFTAKVSIDAVDVERHFVIFRIRAVLHLPN